MKFLKTLTRILVKASLVGLMASFFLMAETRSQFFDIEQSLGNTLETGTLDLGLRSGQPNFVSGAGSMQPGDSVARDIYAQNLGSNPFNYKAAYQFISGDEDLCEALQLKVWHNWYEAEPPAPGDHSTRHMDLKYSGKLVDLVYEPEMTLPNSHPYFDNIFYAENEDWFYYQISLPEETGYLLGKSCVFDFKFKAWQNGMDEADSGFWDEEVIQNTIGTMPLCEDGKEAVFAAPVDRVNIGDQSSEALHNIDGWSSSNVEGGYGGKDDGTYRQVVEETSCNDDGREAEFVLYAGEYKAQLLRIRALDGLSNLDSFEVYVNDNLAGTYFDIQDSAEIWHDFEVPLDNLSGLLEVRLKAIDDIWDSCQTYGQVAVSWAEIEGFVCSEENPYPEIVINEVFYDVDGDHGSEDKNEWIELYNNTGQPINLKNWSLESSFGTKIINSNTYIPPHGFTLLSHDNSTWAKYWDDKGAVTVQLAGSKAWLDNSGDQLTLKDADGDEIDFVAWEEGYDDSYPAWSLDASGGQSIGREQAGVDNDSPEDWEMLEDPNPGTNPHSLNTPLYFWLDEDSWSVGFRIENAAPYDNLNYFLSYNSDSGPQAIGPSDIAVFGQNQIIREGLTLGSCSSQSLACTYHTGIDEINLTIVLTGSGIPDRILTESIVFE